MMAVAREITAVEVHVMRRILLGLAACLTLGMATFASSDLAQAPQRANGNTADQHPDVSGVWFMEGAVEPNLISPKDASMTPWGEEQLKINRRQVNPGAICLPPGVPKSWQVPAPFEIIPLKNRILIMYEHEHMFRQIYMDQHEHAKDLVPTWMGNSIGWWEGDTLVVDTIGFNTLTFVDLWGLPHSDLLHVIERIRRIRPTVLQVEITVDDPKAYTKSWKAVREFDLHPDWQVSEEVCEENNTYLFPHGYAQREP